MLPDDQPVMPPSDTHPAIIIGGGISGLTAALHLAEGGLRPLVLEADPHFCGGRLAGGEDVELDGWHFRMEHGVHGIWAPYRNFHAMLARHDIRPVIVPAQEELWAYQQDLETRSAPVGNAIRRSWLPAPLHYANLLLNQGFWHVAGFEAYLAQLLVWDGLTMALAVDPLAEGQPLEGLSLKDMVRYWPPRVRALFIGLARNGLAGRPEDIPLSGFIAFLRFYTLMRRDSWEFGYLPADGGTNVIEPLAAAVKALGGAVQLGCQVQRLERLADPDGTGELWKVHWQAAESGKSGACLARHVILAADVCHAAKLVQDSFGPAAAGLYWPPSSKTAVARFWFDAPPRPGPEAGIFSGEFVLDNFFWLHRIQDQYRRWQRATGGSALEVHLYGPPELLEVEDAVLLAYARRDVLSLYPELKGHERHAIFQRNNAPHTIFGVGTAERHLGIQTPWPGLFCCGDWVNDPSPAFFLERACATGIKAANAVLAAAGKPAFALLDYLPPEPLAARIESIFRWGRGRLRRQRARRRQGRQQAG